MNGGASPFLVKMELNRRGILASAGFEEIAANMHSPPRPRSPMPAFPPAIGTQSHAAAISSNRSSSRDLARRVLTAPFRGLWTLACLLGRLGFSLLKVVAVLAVAAVILVVVVQSAVLSPQKAQPAERVISGAAKAPQPPTESRRPTAWIGVYLDDLSTDVAPSFGLPPGAGAYVVNVVEGGPAASWNILAGDIVLAIGGRPVWGAADAAGLIAVADVGRQLPIDIARGPNRYTSHPVPLRARERPETDAPAHRRF